MQLAIIRNFETVSKMNAKILFISYENEIKLAAKCKNDQLKKLNEVLNYPINYHKRIIHLTKMAINILIRDRTGDYFHI